MLFRSGRQVIAGRSPPAPAGGFLSNEKSPGRKPGDVPRKPLAEASGMTLAITIRPLPNRVVHDRHAASHRLPPGASCQPTKSPGRKPGDVPHKPWAEARGRAPKAPRGSDGVGGKRRQGNWIAIGSLVPAASAAAMSRMSCVIFIEQYLGPHADWGNDAIKAMRSCLRHPPAMRSMCMATPRPRGGATTDAL